MNWRSSIAAIVSGAGLLATAFGVSLSPSSSHDAPSRVEHAPATAADPQPSDIEQQAHRLRARLQDRSPYTAPTRDPFRFTTRQAPATRRTVIPPPLVAPEPETAPGPRLTLAGIASDVVGGQTQRTAIVSTSRDVQLVRDGEMIEGRYRVQAVGEDSVVVVDTTDGHELTIRLAAGR